MQKIKITREICEWTMIILIAIAVIYSALYTEGLFRICICLFLMNVIAVQWHFKNKEKIQNIEDEMKKHKEWFEFVRKKK
jgi:hypothetical protein